jgi:hypothetical protein
MKMIEEITGSMTKKHVVIGALLVATFVGLMVTWYHFGVVPHDKAMDKIWNQDHAHQSHVTIVQP